MHVTYISTTLFRFLVFKVTIDVLYLRVNNQLTLNSSIKERPFVFNNVK